MSKYMQGKMTAVPLNHPIADTGDYEGYIEMRVGGARMFEIYDGTGAGDDEMDEANMRRIAAAWNACQGIPTEVLEAQQSGGLPWSVADQIEARVVHGVMLDALRLAIGPLAAIPGCAAEYDAVDAAIARATGEKA